MSPIYLDHETDDYMASILEVIRISNTPLRPATQPATQPQATQPAQQPPESPSPQPPPSLSSASSLSLDWIDEENIQAEARRNTLSPPTSSTSSLNLDWIEEENIQAEARRRTLYWAEQRQELEDEALIAAYRDRVYNQFCRMSLSLILYLQGICLL